VVFGGIIAGQVILYGPCFIGSRILLPVNLLARPGVYLPPSSSRPPVSHEEFVLSDQILVYEPMRHFAAQEYAAGRVPLWCPNEYCGVPCVFAKFSLFDVIYYLFPTPYSLIWVQLAKALAAGTGAYLLCRRVMGLRFWPAVLAAWCYPLTGFLVLWQGFYISYTVALFPWSLVAVDGVIRRPLGLWGPAVALLTGTVLTVGAIDIAGQVLLTCGLFALWRLYFRYGLRKWRRALGAGLVLAAAWGLGFVLAAPYLLPVSEYLPTGMRMQRRAQGGEERKPLGLQVLPQVVLPWSAGASRTNSYIGPSNPLESTPSAYAGLLAAGVLAPLGWYRRRLRPLYLFWLVLAVLGLAWALNLWPLVPLFRLPGLNMISFNRWTFVTGLAVLALAAMGLDVLCRGAPPRRSGYLLPMLLLSACAIWCMVSAADPLRPVPPEVIKAADRDTTEKARATLPVYHLEGLGWCLVGGALWAGLWFGLRPWSVPLVGGLLVVELLVFAWDVNPQAHPAEYYPPLPTLEKLAQHPPGRFLGLSSLAPCVGAVRGLRDIRGYDSVDPLRLVELLEKIEAPRLPHPPYAWTVYFRPRLPYEATGKFFKYLRANKVPEGYIDKLKPLQGRLYPDRDSFKAALRAVQPITDREDVLDLVAEQALQLRLPPVLHMLNLRYLIGRGKPPPNFDPIIAGDDYWVCEDPQALPRVFVPATVQQAPEKADLLRALTSPSFDPRRIAYVDGDANLPAECSGSAEIVQDTSDQVTVHVTMQTDGLVVLGDLWYEGWEAELDGRPLPVLRVNHAIRGVVIPAGEGTLQFRYRPRSFARGLQLFCAALAVVSLWAALAVANRRGRKARYP
jgi:hypothetical protein